MGTVKSLIRRWLGIDAPKEKEEKEEKEVWDAVGFLDRKFTITNPGKADQEGQQRILFKVSNLGGRAVFPSHGMAYRVAKEKGWPYVMETEAWVNGGPLPEGFTPVRVSERKPAKLPQHIASDFNARKE